MFGFKLKTKVTCIKRKLENIDWSRWKSIFITIDIYKFSSFVLKCNFNQTSVRRRFDVHSKMAILVTSVDIFRPEVDISYSVHIRSFCFKYFPNCFLDHYRITVIFIDFQGIRNNWWLSINDSWRINDSWLMENP